MANKLLIDRPHAQLLMIDMQERILPAIAAGEELVRRNAALLQIAARLDVPQTVTLQNPEKLGDMPDELAEHFRAPVVLTKMTFSAWREKTVEGHLKHSARKQIILCGIETHVCVLQTALDLAAQGFQIFIPYDAVGSRHPADKEWALRRLEAADCTIVSTESVLFELLVEAGTEEFRELRKLIL